MNALRRDARVAGILYLLMAATAVVSLNNIPSAFVGRSVPTGATLSAIKSSQVSYRIGIVSDLASQVVSVLLVLALYHLLKNVNKRYAALMVALVLVQVPMAFANMLVGMAPLILLSGADYLSVFDQRQLDALAIGSLTLRSYGVLAVMSLWGLWLLPLGVLVVRSGFIPRLLGILLILGCGAYLAVSVTSLLFPAYAHAVAPLTVLAVGEVLLILWLLLKGVRAPATENHGIA